MQLLSSPATKRVLQVLAWNTNSSRELARAVATVGGPFSNVLWSASVCTAETCDPDQSSFNALFASAYFRMCSLGMPGTRPSYSAPPHGGLPQLPMPPVYATAGETSARQQANTTTAQDDAAAVDREATQAAATQKAWQVAYAPARAAQQECACNASGAAVAP